MPSVTRARRCGAGPGVLALVLNSALMSKASAQAQRSTGCYVLGIGPSIAAAKSPVELPRQLRFLENGKVAGARSLGDPLVEPAIGSEWREENDSLEVRWMPN
jgi:hypothetical protein